MAGSTSSTTRTILIHEWVTGGGLSNAPLPASWATEGSAMRRAIARDFASLPDVRVVMTLDHRLPDEPGPWTIARLGPGEAVDRFIDLVIDADYTLLIGPETGGILERWTQVLERARLEMLGSLSEAVALTGDKLRLAKHLANFGIETPLSRAVVPAEGLPERFSYPAVLKPIDGAGSINTFLITDPAIIPDAARQMSRALLQPLVPGVSMSASFLVDHVGVSRLIGVGRQNVVIEGQRFVYRGGIVPASRACFDRTVRRAVETVYGLRGFVGVDYLWDESTGRATILEVNPRPTTSVVALTRLLAAGTLAREWLDPRPWSFGIDLDELAGFVHAQAPLEFRADGTVRNASGGDLG